MAGLTYLLRLIFSRRFWRLLQAFVADGLIHRRLLGVSPRRWIAHIAVFGSFVLLGILSTVTGLAVEILPHLFPSDHLLNTNVISVTLRDVDHPVIALVNDFFGVLILAGLALIVYRRYVERPAQLRTMPADTAIIVLLGGIVISGFPLEAFRLLAHQPLAETAVWGFGGYSLARLIQPLDLAWDVWYNASFWLHFVIANILLFYAPFSRFAHVIMSPVIAALNVTEEPNT